MNEKYVVYMADKDRLGEYAKDGSIKTWPAKDVTGAVIHPRNRTQQRLVGTDYFVVIPANFEFDVVLESTKDASSPKPKSSEKSGSND